MRAFEAKSCVIFKGHDNDTARLGPARLGQDRAKLKPKGPRYGPDEPRWVQNEAKMRPRAVSLSRATKVTQPASAKIEPR